MLKRRSVAALLVGLCACLALPAQAAPVTFNFDTGTPALFAGMGLPLDQTTGGMTAHFSSPSANAFSIQNQGSTGFTLSQFSGNYLYPNNLNRNVLDIHFSQFLTDISLTFATVDSTVATETPGNILLTAYMDSVATPPVGSASANGSFTTDTFPMGTLAFSSATPFNLVRIRVPFQTSGTTDFFVDNVTVTPSQSSSPSPSPVPEPGGTIALLGTGFLALRFRMRRT